MQLAISDHKRGLEQILRQVVVAGFLKQKMKQLALKARDQLLERLHAAPLCCLCQFAPRQSPRHDLYWLEVRPPATARFAQLQPPLSPEWQHRESLALVFVLIDKVDVEINIQILQGRVNRFKNLLNRHLEIDRDGRFLA